MMSENRFAIIGQEYVSYYGGYAQIISNGTLQFMIWEEKEDAQKLCDLLNGLYEKNEHLKNRLYDFEKRKIIEESEIDEDVIPKIKLLRTELFGVKYE